MENLGSVEAGKEEGKAGETVSLWLAGAVILAIIAVFALAGLVIKSLYIDQPVARTAIERDIVKYKELARENPKDISARLGLIDAYVAAKDYRMAERELGEALKQNDKAATLHERLAEIHRLKGDVNKAILEYEKASSLDPKNGLVYYRLGQIYLDRTEYRKAVVVFQKLIEINPGLADAHYYLGLATEKLGDREGARKQYLEALRYIPDYPEAKSGLARVSK